MKKKIRGLVVDPPSIIKGNLGIGTGGFEPVQKVSQKNTLLIGWAIL